MKRTRISIILILPSAVLFLSACCISFPPKEDSGDRKSDTNVMDIRTMELPLTFECGSQTYQPIQQIAVVQMIDNTPAIIASSARGFYVGEGESNTVDDRLYYWSGEEWVLVDDLQIIQNHIQTMTAERDRGIFYVGVGKQSEAGQLLFSTDGGRNWNPVPGWKQNVGRTPLVIRSTEDGTLFIDIGTEIYIGEISGEQWRPMPLPDSASRQYPFTLQIVNPIDSNVIFLETYKVIGGGSGLASDVYRTEDRGKSWTKIGEPEIVGPRPMINPSEFSSLVSDDFFPWSFVPIWIEPLSDHVTVWTAGVTYDREAWNAVNTYIVGYRSIDMGKSWQPRFRIPVCIDHYQNTFAVASGDMLALATKGDGVYFSDDGGENWSALRKGLPKEEITNQE